MRGAGDFANTEELMRTKSFEPLLRKVILILEGRVRSCLVNFGPKTFSPSVKAGLEEWESQAVDAVSTVEERDAGANAEWKSFLGKCVRSAEQQSSRELSGARENSKKIRR
jgi:hypothetical protein